MADERLDARKPQRPSIPVAFACGVVFWASCAAVYTLGQRFGFGQCLAASVVSAALYLACAAAFLALGLRKTAALTASLFLGAFLGSGAAAVCHGQSEQVDAMQVSSADARLVEDARISSGARRAFAVVSCPDGSEITVYADFGRGDALYEGDCLTVSGRIDAADWDEDGYLWAHGAAGRLRVKACEPRADTSPFAPLRGVRKRALSAIGSADERHALLQALVCGYRESLVQTPLYAVFQRCGLAHLVAVSGAHLVLVTGMFAALLRALNVPRRISVAVLVAVMAAYLTVSGMPVSAIRATIMSSIGLLAFYGRRRPSSLNALGIGMFAIIAASPQSSVSTSFALSALSTTGIVLFAPLIDSWMALPVLGRAPFVREALALTFAASVLSQPFSCSVFHQLPLLGPLANVVCAPLFPLVCGAGLVAGVAGAVQLSFAAVIADGASVLAQALCAAAGLVSSIPYASVPVAIGTVPALVLSGASAAVLWVSWSSFDPVKALIAALVAFAVAFGYSYARAHEDAIVMLDVGQGDAFLVRSQGRSLLVDTGNEDARLLEQLALSGTWSLDAVLITHHDDDHCGSLDALARVVHVDAVMMHGALVESAGADNVDLVAQATETAGAIMPLEEGDTFDIGAFTATVVWPDALADDGGNADSLCLWLAYDANGDGETDATALLTGDAEHEQLGAMLSSGRIGPVDLLKVGHHGSANAMDESQARALRPRIAIIGVGEGNRYGHPTQKILDMLEGVGCRVFRSDLDGQVTCRFSCDSIEVSALRLQ